MTRQYANVKEKNPIIFAYHFKLFFQLMKLCGKFELFLYICKHAHTKMAPLPHTHSCDSCVYINVVYPLHLFCSWEFTVLAHARLR